eukprot:5973165-Alexandrium_andersonii.AAC.1
MLAGPHLSPEGTNRDCMRSRMNGTANHPPLNPTHPKGECRCHGRVSRKGIASPRRMPHEPT